jgi:solute carrier family 26 (sodium-independent sulfate anion transporter), member 11
LKALISFVLSLILILSSSILISHNFSIDSFSDWDAMASKVNSVRSKLPVIGQYYKDKATRETQDSYFTTLEPNNEYLEPEPTVFGFIKRAKPTEHGVVQYIADPFPCSKWICNYNLQWLIGDVVASITIGAVVIPQGMAYAKLAQLPVQYGIYTSFIGGLCYWMFGTSKDIAIGPVAVVSIVTAQIVADLAAEHPKEYLDAPALAGILAMMSGVVVALIGVLRLGWLVDLISLPAVSAFITGSALTVTFGQIAWYEKNKLQGTGDKDWHQYSEASGSNHN